MAVQTTKASEVTDLTQDPIDSDKILGYNANTGAGMFSLSRLFNWIKTKTASVITPGDKTPVNADAVNGALTNYANVIETEDLNTLVPNANGKPIMWYSPSGSPANRPNESNIWAGIAYNLWGYPVQIAHSLGNVMFTRTGFPYNNSVAWNSWTQIATKSDLNEVYRVVINNKSDLFEYIRNHPHRVIYFYLEYTDDVILSAGEMLYLGGRDTNVGHGILYATYETAPVNIRFNDISSNAYLR